jgi:hypothetical protein
MRDELIDALRHVMAVHPGEPVQAGALGHTAPLAARGTLGRQLVGEGYLRPVQDGAALPPQGSGARRARRKRETRPGHVQPDGALVTGPVTLTRKGAALLAEAGHPRIDGVPVTGPGQTGRPA